MKNHGHTWGQAMKISQEKVRDHILILLQFHPCHGYEIIQTLSEQLGPLNLPTVYRWLREMESEELIVGKMHPSPKGPKRKIFHLGKRGRKKTRELLKNAMKLVLLFYDAYRCYAATDMYDYIENDGIAPCKSTRGGVFFAAHPLLSERHKDIIEYIAFRNGKSRIDILGDASFLEGLNFRYRSITGNHYDIPVRSSKYREVWISGLPHIRDLPSSIDEWKRILCHGGVLRIIAPFVFFEEPREPRIEEFIRVAAVEFFPELNVVEGFDLATLLGATFSSVGWYEVFPSLVVFWAQKD